MLYSSALKNGTDRQEESSPAILAEKSCLHWGSGSAQAQKPQITAALSAHQHTPWLGYTVYSGLQPYEPMENPREDAYQM